MCEAAFTVVGGVIGVVGGVIGVVVAFVLYRWSARREKGKELSNLSSILLEEMKYNYRTLSRYIPTGERVQARIGDLMSALQNVSTCVFDNYLDRLCALEKHRVKAIYDAYAKIRAAIRIMESDRRMLPDVGVLPLESVSNNILRNAQVALEEIANALMSFPEGKANLEDPGGKEEC